MEEYAQAVAQDPRFDAKQTHWSFWAISREIDNELLQFRQVEHAPDGVVLKRKNITIWMRTWGQLIAENKARLQFFQERLEHSVDRGDALRHLQTRYADLLQDSKAGGAIEDAILDEHDEDNETGGLVVPNTPAAL